MSEIKDGGPAFPVTFENSTRADGFGMTLRDYFAAKAMAAMLTHNVDDDWPEHKNVAKHAYDMADEMLRARGEA
ncbi:hypothetical protein [Burkholderia sp. EMB26]|uniref:hypothetical protein n=1 Tax=Burkholderia sp. EMB26 TaxID=2854261 RepID=UPI00215AB52C|nr:hypothetical protein [Burkholderia sp. EMB26]UVE55280.1 hypothetical protein KU887_06300 [Burkholderia sp. EMB26]